VSLIKPAVDGVDVWGVTPLGIASTAEPPPRPPAPAARAAVPTPAPAPGTAAPTVGAPAGATPSRPNPGRYVPQRSPELAHLSLDRLRSYRRTMMDEELRASYWRRLVQARRDLLRAPGALGDIEQLRDALTEERTGNGRQSVLVLHPQGDMPILPRLPELWAAETGGGAVDDRDLLKKLASAETVLSSYREALHRRLNRATADLVARYHEDPTACFVALPVPDATR
jgi:hypothetical protein